MPLPVPCAKGSCSSYEKDFYHISSGNTNHNIFLVIFVDMALKLEKVGSTFSSFSPCPSLPSIETDNKEQFQFLNIVLNNKTEPFFWN